MEPRDLLTDVGDKIRSISIGYAGRHSHFINSIVLEFLELENATPDRGANKFPIGKSRFVRAIYLGAKNAVLFGGSQVRVHVDLAQQRDVVQLMSVVRVFRRAWAVS